MPQQLALVVYDEDESQECLWTSEQLFGRSRVIIDRKAVLCRVERFVVRPGSPEVRRRQIASRIRRRQ